MGYIVLEPSIFIAGAAPATTMPEAQIDMPNAAVRTNASRTRDLNIFPLLYFNRMTLFRYSA
jgi:hypothetical protein